MPQEAVDPMGFDTLEQAMAYVRSIGALPWQRIPSPYPMQVLVPLRQATAGQYSVVSEPNLKVSEQSSKIPLASLQAVSKLGIDWTIVAVRDDHGRLLPHATLRAARDNFQQAAYAERTGINMITIGKTPKGTEAHIPWKRILRGLNVESFAAMTDKHWTKLEADLKEADAEGLLADRKAGVTAGPPEGYEAFAKRAPAHVHAVFDKYAKGTNTLPFPMLTAFYMVESGETDHTAVETLLRYYVRHTEAFSAGAGPAPKIVRLATKAGKATGAKALEVKPRKPRSDKGGTRG